MSIIVKGKMEMPKNCYGCPFADTTNWERDICSIDEYEKEIFIFADKRPEWCPLIELPQNHGSLIDGDKLIKDLAAMWYDGKITITGISVSELIRQQEIIVESERENRE